MDYVLLRDSTMKNRKIRAALDAQMDLTHSLIFTCALACSIFEILYGDWLIYVRGESIFYMIWLLKNSCEHPVWCHSNGPHWCLCSCPLSTPSKYQESWGHWWLHGKKNQINDSSYSCLCSHIPGDMTPHKTQACNRATQFSFTNLKASCPHHPNARFSTHEKAMIVVDGQFFGRWMHDLLMERLISWLALLLPPTLILPFHVPKFIPATLLKCFQCWRHWIFLVLVVRLLVMCKRVFIFEFQTADVCLGVTQSRTHVQLALACQRSMLFAQFRHMPCNMYTDTLGI